jgi:hypothetical protein
LGCLTGSMRVFVGVKRVIDYGANIRVQADRKGESAALPWLHAKLVFLARGEPLAPSPPPHLQLWTWPA